MSHKETNKNTNGTPILKIETSNNGIAKSAAGTNPIGPGNCLPSQKLTTIVFSKDCKLIAQQLF